MTSEPLKILFLGDVLHPNSKNWISALERYGNCRLIKWSLPSGRNRLKRILYWLISLFQIKRLVRENKPDIIIGYRITSYGFLASGIKSCPIVIAAQGESDVWPPYGLVSKIVTLLARRAVNKAQLIQAWGPHMANSIYKLGADKNKVWIMPRGIDLNIFSYPTSLCDFNELRIVVTRSLHSDYRHSVIIDALRILREKQIPFTLSVVGDGPLRTSLMEKVNSLGLEKQIFFLGKVDRGEIVSLLHKSNVYVSMPITEGVSASLLEAFACGCIPCVSKLEANSYWINHEENGFLIPIDDSNGISDALIEIYKNPKKFAKIRIKNRSVVENRASAEKNTKLMVTKYRELIKK